MDLFTALFNRRSIRKYTTESVEQNLLVKIIECGMYAPSAVNKQPWHFIIFQDIESIEKIIEVHPHSAMLKEASAGILVCFDKNLQHDEGYGPIDCSAATQNMLLAAHGLGLGACWVGIYPRQNRIEALHKLFCLPEHVVPFSVISIGYSDGPARKADRFLPERIHYEKWNSLPSKFK